MRSGFVWDDDKFLHDNPLIEAANGLHRFWFTTQPPDYFPVTSSMLWLEWRLWEEDATGYHVVNVLIHIASSLLLWRILERLKIPGAWFAALVFGIHPVNVESVAWITERKNTLPMLWGLASLLTYVNWRERNAWQTPDPNRKQTGNRLYGLSLALFLLALLSKTSVVMLPVVMLAITWWKTGRIARRDIYRSAPFFGIAGILSAVTVWYQYNRAIGEFVVRDDSFLSRTVIAGRAVWFYLYKSLLPLDLRFVYPRWEADTGNPLSYVPVLMIPLVALVLWKLRPRAWARACLVALGTYGAMLLPVLGFFDIFFMMYSLVADHWQYSAIPAVIVLAVAGAATGFRRWESKRIHGPRIGRIVATLVAAIFCVLSWRQQAMYKDEETLYQAIIARDPTVWMAQNNLGAWLYERDRKDEALSQWHLTIRLKHDHPEAHNNIGRVLNERGIYDKALWWCSRALDFRPNWGPVHWNVARLLTKTGGDPNLAAYHFLQGLDKNPNDKDANYDLAVIFGQQGNFTEAEKYFSRAVQLAPDWAAAHHGLSAVLMQMNRQEEAFVHLQRAVELDPFLPEAQTDLGNYWFGRGDYAKAIVHYQRALQLNPGFFIAAYNLAATYKETGQTAAAIDAFRHVLKIDPNSQESRQAIEDLQGGGTAQPE